MASYATLASVKARLGITDASDDALLQTLIDAANAWIEGETGRVVAPRAETVLLLDGSLAEPDCWGVPRRLPCPFGVRSLTKVEVAMRTGGTYTEVPTSDWFLRPAEHLRRPGWPATMLVLTDVPSGQIARFYPGYDTVRLTGAFGWEAIPDDLAEVAEVIVVRAWHARQAGQADAVGSDQTGTPVVSRFVSAKDRETVARYSLRLRVAGGGPLITSWSG